MLRFLLAVDTHHFFDKSFAFVIDCIQQRIELLDMNICQGIWLPSEAWVYLIDVSTGVSIELTSVFRLVPKDFSCRNRAIFFESLL